MVDVLGHFGMALIWLAPSWFFIDRPRTAALFVATGFWFGMLPDTDLYLSKWFAGIHHHGVVHTVLAVTLLTAVLGPLLGLVQRRIYRSSDLFDPEAAKHAITMGVIAVWVAGLSHLFADVLSAPDVSTRIEPLWPLVKGPIVYVDVLYYKSFWATWALLLTGLALNVALWYWKRERHVSGSPSQS